MAENHKRKPARGAQRTLVMFSGGIDSTAALWHVLHHPEEYGQIHVHHIHIQNIEARWRAEAEAVKAVLSYMRQYAPAPFTLSESAINTPHFGGKFLYDTEILSFMTGYMTSRDPQITKVVIGATGTDFESGATSSVVRGKAIHNAFHPTGNDHSAAVKEYPMGKLTKEQVYNTLPPDLAVLTWSCRTPNYADGKPLECGVCKTCVLELKGVKRQPAPGKRVTA
jgi:7-cyano-7-deazaguanine synthase in queuosine biosynthesis